MHVSFFCVYKPENCIRFKLKVCQLCIFSYVFTLFVISLNVKYIFFYG